MSRQHANKVASRAATTSVAGVTKSKTKSAPVPNVQFLLEKIKELSQLHECDGDVRKTLCSAIKQLELVDKRKTLAQMILQFFKTYPDESTQTLIDIDPELKSLWQRSQQRTCGVCPVCQDPVLIDDSAEEPEKKGILQCQHFNSCHAGCVMRLAVTYEQHEMVYFQNRFYVEFRFSRTSAFYRLEMDPGEREPTIFRFALWVASCPICRKLTMLPYVSLFGIDFASYSIESKIIDEKEYKTIVEKAEREPPSRELDEIQFVDEEY